MKMSLSLSHRSAFLLALVTLSLLSVSCCDASSSQHHPYHASTSQQHHTVTPTTSTLTKKFPSSSTTYPTNTLHHLEPVLGYKLIHEDNEHLHAAHDADELTQEKIEKLKNNHVSSLAAHSLKSRVKQGLHQPYPNTITVEFHAYGERFYLPQMQLSTHLFAPHSKTTVSVGTFSYEVPNVLQSYHYRDAFLGVDATVTLHENGLFHGLVTRRENGSNWETYQIDPLTHYASSMEQADFDALDRASHHGVAVFKQSHSKGKDGVGGEMKCGSLKPPKIVDGVEIIDENPEIHLETPPSITSSTSRKLLYTMTGDGVRRWTNCYPDEATGRLFNIGIGVDYTMYQKAGSTIAKAQTMVAVNMANVNTVYIAQFNVFVQVGEIYIKTQDGGELWNNAARDGSGHCSIGMSTELENFRRWHATERSRQNSIWHLLTDCYGPTGVVGMAYVGVVCSEFSGVGITSWTQDSTYWRFIAHEIGHNFNMLHTFQNGQGNTGGLMDYNAYDYPKDHGVIQFNDFNIPDFCPYMSSDTLTGSAAAIITPFCYQPYAPTCGNNVVDVGEECDDTSSCCRGCRFAPGAVCSSGGVSNPCCNAGTCQYLPVTNGCNLKSGNGDFQGYCRNGHCEYTTCTAYKNATQCGFYNNNPCQQQCLYNGVCGGPPTYPGVNLNLPDGTMCSQSPVSTCLAGQCVAQADQTGLTYHWTQINPSICNCTGTQTLSVVCKDSNGFISNSTKCPVGSKPASTATCAPGPQCSIWKQLGFGNCSVNCGSGTQTQTVQCVKTLDQSVVLPVSSCDAASKPASSRNCSLTATCPVGWVAGGYGQCSKPCDGGLQTQTVQCMQTQNGIKSAVDPVACAKSGTQPPTQQTCNVQKCGAYSWSYGTWGNCNAQCGGGNHTRSATCVQTQGSTTVPVLIGNCTVAVAGIPATQEKCNTPLCPNRQWKTGPYSDCTATCGGGSQTRTVQCFDLANDPTLKNPLPTDYCIDAKPVSILSCNMQECPVPVVLQWYTGDWSACSISGCQPKGGSTTGVSTRDVYCVDSNDKTVPKVNKGDQACISSTTAKSKPSTTQSCNVNACATYGYVTGDWSSCSKACDGGKQTRSVDCKELLSQSIVDASFCNSSSSSIPTASQDCNTDACSGAAQWSTSDWSHCSQACGGGYHIRSVTCVDSSSNMPTTDSSCPAGSRPTTKESCNTPSCGTYWSTSSWSQCTSTCGVTGTQTRTVTCKSVSGGVSGGTTSHPDSACSGTKPSTQASCNRIPCPSYVADSTWSECSERCNQGTQTRNVTCQAYDGTTLDMISCQGASLPVVSRICTDMQCPHWHRGAWSECSQSCNTGNQTRSLVCRMPHDNITYGEEQPDTSLCPPIGSGDIGDGVGEAGVTVGQPPYWQPCNIAVCPTYYWKFQNALWTDCTAACGDGGITTNTAVCTNSNSGLPADDSLCLDTKPSETLPCNRNIPCPTYQYQVGNWSECLAFCGDSTQMRVVECFNISPPEDMHLPQLKVDSSFCVNAGLTAPDATQPCVNNPAEICHGSSSSNSDSSDSNIVVNGKCLATTGQCQCRTGIIGVTCNQTEGLIWNVKTNAQLFTDGIPIDEPLLVTWDSLPATKVSIPFLHIVLLKSNMNRTNAATTPYLGSEWNTAQYLGANQAHTGVFQWTIGSRVPDLESGNGYRVRLWVSRNYYVDSDTTFTLADPCAYKTCGQQGQCTNGKCVCNDGFSGESCTIGPCQRASCSSTTANCDNIALVTSGQTTTMISATQSICNCTSGYSGLQCNTPPACASSVQCLNGGDLDPISLSNSQCTSASCACPNFWSGSRCETCSLTCSNGGSASNDCAECSCPAGFDGTHCGCKYYLMNMQLNMDASAWKDDAVQVARFKRVISADIQLAALASSAQQTSVEVESLDFTVDGKIQVTVRFGLKCPEIIEDSTYLTNSEADSTTIDNVHVSARYSHVISRLVTTVPTSNATLSTVYSSMLPYFESMDSPLWQGQLTSKLDSSYPITVRDPTDQDKITQPSQPQDCFTSTCTAQNAGGGGDNGNTGNDTDDSSSSGSNVGMIVGIVIAILVVVFIAIVGIYCFYSRSQNAKSDKTARHIEMSNRA